MSFLAPALLAALAALAIPIYLHLVQRERKQVIPFPSLMFIKRVPYRSVRRHRVRHWLLLMLRAAALALVVVAFGRPFFVSETLATVAGAGAREVVILVDRSASLRYGAHWARAQEAARAVVNGLAPADRATLVFFDEEVEVAVRSSGDGRAILGAIDRAAPSARATAFGPAIKVATSILEASELTSRAVVLVSDFQQLGWNRGEPLRLPDGVRLTPVSVAEPSTANVTIAGVSIDRDASSGRERLVVTARLSNRSDEAVSGREVSLEIGGRTLETAQADIEARATTVVTFAAVAAPPTTARGIVRVTPDALTEDNAFYFVASPATRLSVLVGEGLRPRADASLYLSRALAVGRDPSFAVRVAPATGLAVSDLDAVAVVVLNDAPVPTGAVGRALAAFVERGGGLLVVLGERAAWTEGSPDLLPARFGAPVDRLVGRGGTLGYVDYSHPIFELFSVPHNGDLTAGRFFRYRAVGDADRVLARFDDGHVALAEQRVGAGRVLLWASTLDTFWNDLAVKPVYVPLVHQAMKYLADYATAEAWLTVGDTVDLTPRGHAAEGGVADLVALAPSGARLPFDGERPGLLSLGEQGFYEVRRSDPDGELARVVAANIDPAESDLTAADPDEFVAAVTGGAGETVRSLSEHVPRAELERRQSLWRWVLVLALLLFVVETVYANRLPRRAT
jgi:hypothetical protein